MRCSISRDFAFSCKEPLHCEKIECTMPNVQFQCSCNLMQFNEIQFNTIQCTTKLQHRAMCNNAPLIYLLRSNCHRPNIGQRATCFKCPWFFLLRKSYFLFFSEKFNLYFLCNCNICFISTLDHLMIDLCFVKTPEQVFNGHCDRWEGSDVLLVILITSPFLSFLSSLSPFLSSKYLLSSSSSLCSSSSLSSSYPHKIKNLARCAKEWKALLSDIIVIVVGGQVSNGCFCTSSVSTYRYTRQTWRPTMDFGTEVVCYDADRWQMLSVSCAPGVWNVASEGAAQDRWQILDSLWEVQNKQVDKLTNK